MNLVNAGYIGFNQSASAVLTIMLSGSLLFSCNGQDGGIFGGASGNSKQAGKVQATAATRTVIDEKNRKLTTEALSKKFDEIKRSGSVDIAAFKETSTTNYFADISSAIGNEPIEIMGYQFSNLAEKMERLADSTKIWEKHATLGDYFASLGIPLHQDLQFDAGQLESLLEQVQTYLGDDFDQLLADSSESSYSTDLSAFLNLQASEGQAGAGTDPVKVSNEDQSKDFAGCVGAIGGLIAAGGACIACVGSDGIVMPACAGCFGGGLSGGVGIGKECRGKGKKH